MKRIQKLLQSEQPLHWVFEGDSITHGALHTFGWRDYTEHFTERIRFELGRPGDHVIKSAVSGNSTKDLLAGFDRRVKHFRPDVVFCMVGMNDCSSTRDVTPDAFRDNLRKWCRQVVEISALPVLQTTCPILPGTAPDREPNIDFYMDIIRGVAREEKLPLVDHTKFWKENPATFYFWMSDAFHPNHHGHQVFAELLFKEIGIFDPKSATCRLFRP